MAKQFLTKINAKLSVSVLLVKGTGWEIGFIGEQGVKEFGIKNVIWMWKEVDDPDGLHAKKVHDKAVVLLQARTSLKNTYTQIKALILEMREKIHS